MRLHGLVPTLAVAALCVSPFADAATCKRLIDADSKFVSAVATAFSMKDADVDTSLFQNIDTAYPWLSKCVAAVDPISVIASTALSSGFSSCNQSISTFVMPTDLTDTAVRTVVCPFYGNTLMPCINNVLVQAVVDAMGAAGECCDDMRSQIQTNYGSNLKTMAAELLNKVGAVGCSVKTSTDSTGKSTTESCGHALKASFFTDASSTNSATMMQMPTDQVCKAMAGKEFTTTTGTSAQFSWATLGLQSFGICYEPLSDLFETLASYPVMSSWTTTVNGATLAMSDLFTTGKCVKSSSILAWLADEKSPVMILARTVDDAKQLDDSVYSGSVNMTTKLQTLLTEYQTELPASCMRLASGQNCDYSGATVQVSYAVDGKLATEKSLAVSTWSLALTAVVAVVVNVVAM